MLQVVSGAQILTASSYRPGIGPAVPRPLITDEHYRDSSNESQRLKDYKKYLLNIRKNKHLQRVSKTRFLSKLVNLENYKKKTKIEPFPFEQQSKAPTVAS